MAKKEYEVKGITTSIKFTSRASVKINDNYYTLEACEERMIPNIEGVDIQKEKEALWDSVNNECDKQTEDILNVYSKSKK